MTHLSEQALVDLAEEGAGAATARDHLARCARCRARVDALRATMQALREDQVPEPSPLFWDQLSGRILASLDAQPAAAPGGWWVPRWRWALPVAAGALLVAVLAPRPASFPRTDPRASTGSTGITLDDPGAGIAAELDWTDAGQDESWSMLVGLAEDLESDAALDAGIFVRPGSIEQAVLMLSEEERRDLARAIRAELGQSSL